ncbi:FAS1 domain-containing protein [Thamnidium elegans]|nr:FAS1 domain-containing protein [Thamnidium elegans]
MTLKKFTFLLLFITTLLSFCSASLFSKTEGGERKSIYDLLTIDKRFTRFIQHIEETDAVSEFKSIDKGTVFVPTNEAFDNHYIAQRKLEKEQLLYHILPVSIKSSEFYDGQVSETEATLHGVTQRLKIKKSLTKDIHVGSDGGQEESHVIDADMDARNGVIHVVDKILSLPKYLDETLSLVEETKNFHDLAKKAHIDKELRQAKRNTIFVAKDDFFGDDFDPVQKKYLLGQGEGIKDLARYLNHQISDDIYHSGDFKEGRTVIKTSEGSEDLEIDAKHNKLFPSTLTVNGVKVIHSDILSANGVIHVLESPILPKNKDFVKLNARKVLSGMNATRFIELFDENGLGSYLDDQHDVITILAPPNDSLDEKSFTMKGPSKDLLKYHIIQGRYEPSDLQDGQLLETESHDNLGDAYQRLNVHINSQSLGLTDHKLFRNNIQFGKSAVLGDPVKVGDNLIIYAISNSLVLPENSLEILPTNLDLSTFVAGLYASEAKKDIRDAKGITLFAPNNEAFQRLGLLAKYLLKPESSKKLKQVVTYHAVRGIFYENSTRDGEQRQPTLSSGAEITLNKTSDGFFIRGYGAADGDDRNIIGKVIKSDTLSSNGVIHTIDRVQVPKVLQITNRNLLTVGNTNSMIKLLERADLADKVLDVLDKDSPYTILAPTDRAFGRFNLSQLLEDHDKLIRLARSHIIPVALPRLNSGDISQNNFYYNIFGRKKYDQDTDDRDDHKDVPYLGVDIPTLNKDEYIVFSKNVNSGYTVRIKGTLTDYAQVIDLGQSSANGGVIEIDGVLLPKKENKKSGLPWWAVALIVIASLIGIVLVALGIYAAYRYYQSRRGGDISLGGN